MKRYQARPRWELDRALRRRVLLNLGFWVVAGFVIAISVYALLVVLFTS